MRKNIPPYFLIAMKNLSGVKFFINDIVVFAHIAACFIWMDIAQLFVLLFFEIVYVSCWLV